ncbi:MAG: NAD-dependent epimerase/dehydratase family protein [Coriobacteriia bacterium]|nr:NAD-dependent epimerase/dehydratase family protein [Coriobacteriia bacterium]
MKILVTGGAGFIGSALIHQLISLEGEVLVVDDLSTGFLENVHPACGFRKMSICEAGFGEIAAQFSPDVIVHLAAQSSVTRSLADPAANDRVNLDGTRAVAQAAIDSGAVRVVFASSAAVYGNPAEIPLTEASAKDPQNPYGASKLAGEAILAEMLGAAGIDYVFGRFANVYGPRQSALGEAGVVAAICSRIAAGDAPIINGDGTQTRDFVYVGDVVSALTLLIGHDLRFASIPGADGPAFNISTGQGADLCELLTTLRQITGFHGREEHGEPPADEVHTSILSAEKAADILEWAPEVELADGLQAAWNWFKEQSPRI